MKLLIVYLSCLQLVNIQFAHHNGCPVSRTVNIFRKYIPVLQAGRLDDRIEVQQIFKEFLQLVALDRLCNLISLIFHLSRVHLQIRLHWWQIFQLYTSFKVLDVESQYFFFPLTFLPRGIRNFFLRSQNLFTYVLRRNKIPGNCTVHFRESPSKFDIHRPFAFLSSSSLLEDFGHR